MSYNCRRINVINFIAFPHKRLEAHTSVVSQLIEEVTAHAQSDSLEDAREIYADGTYFPNNLRIRKFNYKHYSRTRL